MTNEYQIRVQPHVAANEQALRSYLADEYGFDVRTVTAVRILRRSIDARQRTIFVNLKVRVYCIPIILTYPIVHRSLSSVQDRVACLLLCAL